MKFCPLCQATYGNQIKFCPVDGTPLESQEGDEERFVGRILADRYEVLKRLGAGGFGTVYKVRDQRLDDIEALKVFDRRRLPPPEAAEAVERFKREAKLLRRLGKHSRHIVGVTNLIEDPDEFLFYFAMEFVDGDNIAQIIIREGPLEMWRAIALIRQLCQALQVAHGEGVIHRDLKLENLMVTRDGQEEVLKVLDFGIAKILGTGSITDLRVGAPGTPGYAAPEQIDEPALIDHRTDLFAVGVVLFAMLTGREPWTGGAVTEPTSDGWGLLRATMEHAPIPLREIRSELPAKLEAIVTKLLSKRREDRYGSAQQLAAAFNDVERRDTAGTGGSIVVDSQKRGVKVALRSGRRTVAKGATRWTGRSLPPGDYRVDVVDSRFEHAAHEVALRAGERQTVQLDVRPAAGASRPRRWLPVGVAAGTVAAAAAGWWLFGPDPRMDPGELGRHLERGEVSAAEFEGEALRVRVAGSDGHAGSFVVPLAGARVQETMRRVADAEVRVDADGSSRVRFDAAESGTRRPLRDAVATLDGLGPEGCAPCPPGQTRDQEAGWYRVLDATGEWTVDSLIVRVSEPGFRDEVVDVHEEGRIWVPSGAEIEVTFTASLTEVGRLIEDARRVVSSGGGTARSLEQASELLERALLIDPGNETATRLFVQLFPDRTPPSGAAAADGVAGDAGPVRGPEPMSEEGAPDPTSGVAGEDAPPDDPGDEVAPPARDDATDDLDAATSEAGAVEQPSAPPDEDRPPATEQPPAQADAPPAEEEPAEAAPPDEPDPAAGIVEFSLGVSTAPLALGESRRFTVTARDADRQVVPVTVSVVTSRPEVLRVTPSFEVVGLSEGSSWLIVRFGSRADSVELTVRGGSGSRGAHPSGSPNRVARRTRTP